MQFKTVTPEMTLLQSSDGAPIRVLLYKPPDLDAGRKHPAVALYVWNAERTHDPGCVVGESRAFSSIPAQQGFVVALIDDRTSAIPGHQYSVAAFRGIGPVAAKDHEFAVQYLKSLRS